MLREHTTGPILVRGQGTAPDWGGRAEPPDVVVETNDLNGVLRHDPEDMTVAVRAGTRLDTLQEALAEYGQRISVDPARAVRGASIGGLVATADAGPLRQAFGSLRELVIGVAFVLADGTSVRSGGQVIKNVAGYDLSKLLHGSLGTLGILTEIVLRVHPLPKATTTIAVSCSAAEAVRAGRALVGAAIEPAALEWSDGTLYVRVEGTPAGTDDRARRVLDLVEAGSRLSESEARAAWDRMAAVALADPGDTVVRLGTLPSATAWLVDLVARLAERHGVDTTLTCSVGTGIHNARLRQAAPGRHAALLEDLRKGLAAGNGTAVVIRPDGLEADFPTRGQPPAGINVMRAIKKRFDPGGRLGTGRFAPWF